LNNPGLRDTLDNIFTTLTARARLLASDDEK
jgi:hypothetical protein